MVNGKKLRILQIGAGSMGSRRLRDLSQRSDVEVALFDQRADRLEKAVASFSVKSFASLTRALDWGPDALSISTPPDRHEEYIGLALSNGLHHFCEAQLWTYDFRKIEEAARKGFVCASSCSLHFLPIVKTLKKLVEQELGTLHAYQMALSTYMPSWHPDEGTEYYARHRHTTAGREMVPFELLYLNEIFGTPVQVSGFVNRRGDLDNDPDTEDTWSLQMTLEGGSCGQLTVLQASPSIVRKGCCFGSAGSIDFDLFSGKIVTRFADGGEKIIDCGSQNDVLEAAYKEEIDTFVEAVVNKEAWPHSYYESAQASAALAAAEKSAITGKTERVVPDIQPEYLPQDYGDSRP